MSDKKKKIKKGVRNQPACTPLLLSPVILCLWLSFKEKPCLTPINYHGRKGYKEGLQGQKSYHSKKEKTCLIPSNNCAVKV